MRNYQLILVLKPNLAEPAKKKITDSVKSWLRDAKITKEEDWGQKELSYEIKKQNSGLFLSYYIETEVIDADFEKRLLSEDDILRHLLVKTINKKEQQNSKEEKKEEKSEKKTIAKKVSKPKAEEAKKAKAKKK